MPTPIVRITMSADTPVRGAAPTAAPAPPATQRPSIWAGLRPLVLRLHFYAGVLIAPLLFVAAATGLLYALSFQAENVVYRHELRVPAGDTAQPLTAQVAAAKAAHPEGEVTAVWPSPEKGATTRVLMKAPGLGADESLAVFVNPYTNEVRGALPSTGSSGALPLRSWLSSFHADLKLGEFGRNYSELAASWLWVVALGGVLLWVGRRRRTRLLRPERGATGRRRTLSWHGSVGLWAAVGLVLLSATGLTWSRYAGENIAELKDRVGGATPTVAAATSGGAGGGGHEHHEGMVMPPAAPSTLSLDQVAETARAQGVRASIQISLPSQGKGFVVRERDSEFPVHLDSVAIDPADGRVMDVLRFSDYPLLAKLTRFGIDAHMGLFLGLANQLALAALAVALMALIVWGYRMWWQRRPTKGSAFGVGRPQPRGAWRKVPVPVLLGLAAPAALVGWFVPLLGISLLAFLAVDVLLGLRGRVRRA
ncbi:MULTISPECIES: PepSY-associated TM helix domain-containing protein [unclassified Streptomyces]|uniref:PepSY-associated TM helix domain-containing protein n=1 Tax=unclassified Streptomyces TaxID=2593676 RepID=UPI003812F9F1